MALPDDPFVEVITAIWGLLEDSTAVTDLVSVGNRIKWATDFRNTTPAKVRKSISDLPEISIFPSGGAFNYHLSSSDVEVVQRFSIAVESWELRLHVHYFPLKWAMLKALSHLDSTLTFDYVTKAELEDSEEDMLQTKHPGWQTVMDIVVTMHFSRAEMKA